MFAIREDLIIGMGKDEDEMVEDSIIDLMQLYLTVEHAKIEIGH